MSTVAIPSGTIIVLQPPLQANRVRWFESFAYIASTDNYQRVASASRHHTDICAPYWTANLYRLDECGREWMSKHIFMVDNGFGVLVEVPGP